MSATLLCSGQGRLDASMFDIFVGTEAAEPVFAAATRELGIDPRSLIASASSPELHANRTSQLLCVTRALAAAAGLALPDRLLLAGYSVGEMAAWSIGGWWTPADCLRAVSRRAELMDATGGSGGGLGHVRGLPRPIVERLAHRFDCAIAIVNPGLLFVVGGTRENVAAFCEAARAEGAVSAGTLAVNVASHTRMLEAAVAPLMAELASVPLGEPHPARRIIGASEVRIVGGQSGLASLARQIAAPIDWAAILEDLAERGARRVLELGPGSALAEMARSAGLGFDARALDEFRSLSSASRWISGEAP